MASFSDELNGEPAVVGHTVIVCAECLVNGLRGVLRGGWDGLRADPESQIWFSNNYCHGCGTTQPGARQHATVLKLVG